MKEGKSRRRGKGINLAALILLAAFVLQLSAREVPGFAQIYSVTVYRFLVAVIGRLMSLFPFSVVEVGLYLLTLAAAAGLLWILVRAARGQIRWSSAGLCVFRTVFFATAALFFFYTVGCGINYHRTAFSAAESFVIAPSSREELAGLCRYLAEEINEAARDITVDENGCMVLPANASGTAREAMEALGEEYSSLQGYYPHPKGLWISRILSVQKIEGIYSPFTLEANYNREMPDVNIPVTMCHELSHLRGFMREDEANFIAYLACRKSGDAGFRYSGAILAFIHSGNALYRDGGEEAYWEIYDSLCDTARRDLSADSAFWRQFDGKVAQVSSQVNDAYLKANRQEDGVKSYGRMVDLLLAMYREGRQ